MNTNVIIPSKITYTPIDSANFVVAAGGAGWIDTDVSATTGTNPDTVWLVHILCNGDAAGVRAHGETKAPLVTVGSTTLQLTKVDSSGHADLYRNAAVQSTYTFIGSIT